MAEKRPPAAKATKKAAATSKTETTKPKVVRTRKPKTAAAVTPEQIAERAYYLWAEGSAGDAFAHWVQAERELTAA